MIRIFLASTALSGALVAGCNTSASLVGHGAVQAESSQLTAAPIQVYSWSKPTTLEQNSVIHPFSWILDATEAGGVARVKAELDAQPVGQRTLFWFHGYEDFMTNVADQARDSMGNLSGHPYPDLTNGVAAVKPRIDAFYRAYKESGGELDQLVVDFEGGLSFWNLQATDYPAIQADPRFLTDLVPLIGFSDLVNDLTIGNSDNVLKWNDATGVRVMKALDEVLVDTAKVYFPNVTASNYGGVYHDPSFKLPDINGWRNYLWGRGAIIGTHQSPVLYGYLGNITLPYPWVLPEGVASFANTPFHSLVFDVNNVRSAYLSRPDVPLASWLSNRAWYGGRDDHLNMYDELVFHAALSGNERFLYWDGSSATHDDDMQALYIDMKELNAIAGFAGRTTLETALVDWSASYVLSGARLGKKNIYRFTADPAATVTQKTDASGLHIQVNDAHIDLKGAQVKTGGVSALGFWIVQDAE